MRTAPIAYAAVVFCSLTALISACDRPLDTDPTDGGLMSMPGGDAGSDSGTAQNDSGLVDSGVIGNPDDAGTQHNDAGAEADAGHTDAGPQPDAGSPDASTSTDAGTPHDAGTASDAGAPVDAGTAVDAGTGTGFDAGSCLVSDMPSCGNALLYCGFPNTIKVAQPAPTPTGGTVLDGDYTLTESAYYTGSSGMSGATNEWVGATLSLHSGNFAWGQYNAQGGPPSQPSLAFSTEYNGTFSTSGTSLTLSATCPYTGVVTYNYSVSGSHLLLTYSSLSVTVAYGFTKR